ncbi:MAG: response regulator transcription factor [Betaproteobacteria bacterium]|nr:response regulator transcription factor [Betaproteobacteria bacterium]
MKHIFLSNDARQRDNWQKAFPDLIAGRLDRVPTEPGLLWVLLPEGQSGDEQVRGLGKALAGRPLIVLADEPSEDGAMAALGAGAVGYCNGHAAPQVLRQIAGVVDSGGVWVGQALMQRLLAATARLLPVSTDEHAAWRRTLTAREQEVALALAQGASNKEIARQLDITERTVKSHVSAMLEKLGARDRLQLSLHINGIDSKR